jgi:hypothetical protein
MAVEGLQHIELVGIDMLCEPDRDVTSFGCPSPAKTVQRMGPAHEFWDDPLWLVEDLSIRSP